MSRSLRSVWPSWYNKAPNTCSERDAAVASLRRRADFVAASGSSGTVEDSRSRSAHVSRRGRGVSIRRYLRAGPFSSGFASGAIPGHFRDFREPERAGVASMNRRGGGEPCFRPPTSPARPRYLPAASAVASRPDHRNRLWKVLARSAIAEHKPFVAHEALLGRSCRARSSQGCSPPISVRATGWMRTIAIVEEAHRYGDRHPETVKLLIDLHYRRGDVEALRAVAKHGGAGAAVGRGTSGDRETARDLDVTIVTTEPPEDATMKAIKRIEAIVKPFALGDIKEAVLHAGTEEG